MISTVPSVSSVHVELDDRLSSTTGRTDVTTKGVDSEVLSLLSYTLKHISLADVGIL